METAAEEDDEEEDDDEEDAVTAGNEGSAPQVQTIGESLS
jgi:hypothetical protein